MTLDVHDLKTGDSLVKEVERLANNVTKPKDGDEKRRDCSFVLELADTPDAALALKTILPRHRVITTGVIGATIAQDDTCIGIELASSLIRCKRRGGKCKIGVVVASEELKPGRGHRVVAFKGCIEEAMRAGSTVKYTFETIIIEKSGHRHAHELCARLLNKEDNANLSDCDVVFSAAGEFAESLLRFYDVNPGRQPPKVFTADITPSLLNLMWEPDSALQAMCGVEPFSYGRLIVRAACDTGLTTQICVSASLFQRQDILNAGVGNYAQLLATYPKLLLDGAEFA